MPGVVIDASFDVDARFGRARTRGFTLVELLVALSIIGLLLAVAAPKYFDAQTRAKEVALRTNLRAMREAIDKFQGDRRGLPQSLQDLVAYRYLRSIPVDPMTDSAQTWVEVRHPDDATLGLVDVLSGAPGTARDGSAFRTW